MRKRRKGGRVRELLSVRSLKRRQARALRGLSQPHTVHLNLHHSSARPCANTDTTCSSSVPRRCGGGPFAQSAAG